MSWVTAILVYVMIWWVVFFAILPWGVRRGGDTDAGHDAGAPVHPALLKKALITTGLAAVIFLLVWWVIEEGYFDRLIRPSG